MYVPFCPNNSSSQSNSNVSKTVSNGVGVTVVLYVTYQIFKWGMATVLAPYTGGGSYAAAGAMP